jgi:hypothetical protein
VRDGLDGFVLILIYKDIDVVFEDSFNRSILPMSVIAHTRGRCVAVCCAIWLTGIHEGGIWRRAEECGTEDNR